MQFSYKFILFQLINEVLLVLVSKNVVVFKDQYSKTPYRLVITPIEYVFLSKSED